MPCSLVTLVAALSLVSPLRAGLVIDDAFDETSAARLAGSATIDATVPRGRCRLTNGPGETGAVWAGERIDLDGRLIANVAWSFDGSSDGTVAVVMQFGDDAAFVGPLAGPRVDEAGPPFVAAVIDLAATGDPRLTIVDANGPLAPSNDLPDLTAPADDGGRWRISVVLDDASVAVLAVAESRGFRARELARLPFVAPRVPVLIGAIATSGAGATTHRVDRIAVDAVAPRPGFVRGDCDQDGSVCGSVTDMIRIVLRCFQGGVEFPCEDACDANDDGVVCGSVSDVVWLANHCFLGGPRPPAPFDSCGEDRTTDAIGCEDPRACGALLPAEPLFIGANEFGFDEYLRVRDGMEMVLLPAGRFEQGDRFLDFGAPEIPTHEVTLTSPFLFAKYEVTNGQYLRFLNAIGATDPDVRHTDRRYDYDGPATDAWDGDHYPEGTDRIAWARRDAYFEPPEFAEHPVIGVDWFDAVAYSRWANDETSHDWSDPTAYGIATESQWEYAARFRPDGSAPARYPWGGSEGNMNDPRNIGADRCNYGNLLGHTLPVTALPEGRSAFGIHHMAGNVYEWTADWYDESVYTLDPRVDPFVSRGAEFRQLRGGGWFGVAFSVRGAYRCNFRPQDPDVDIGIRCTARAPHLR